ncbi:Tat pathway signal sequence domain protein [Necator americanus]|uniref:Tat pathway signal sequence domain protein n=1 Tax=Necator americanus TaxID=51031 RepID=W2TYP7_NECAM|nr:Tat pathway signal sequence domain protein [Necator americanus]ETN87200.1 Tat pathway signal sequence domain protein [Necator americanus]
MNRFPQSGNTCRNIIAGAASGLAMLAFPNVAIAMYVMWKAIEIIFYDLVKQGKIRPLPYGDLLLYTVSTGYVLWQIIIEPQAIRKGYLKFLLGLTGNSFSHCLTPSEDIMDLKKLPDDFHALLAKLRHDFNKAEKCEHKYSCVSVAVESFVKNFAIGTGISGALVLLGNLRKLLTNPCMIPRILFSLRNLKLPLFFGLMPFLFHVTRCLLNRRADCPKEISDTVAGIVSGASMTVYPSVTIGMYTMWKGIEVTYVKRILDQNKDAVYLCLMESKILPAIPFGDIILYTFSTAYMLWATIVEPQAIRKGYLGFLTQLTGNRIIAFNRDLYEHFGFQSKLMFPHAQPVLNTKYVTLNPMLYQKIMPPH